LLPRQHRTQLPSNGYCFQTLSRRSFTSSLLILIRLHLSLYIPDHLLSLLNPPYPTSKSKFNFLPISPTHSIQFSLQHRIPNLRTTTVALHVLVVSSSPSVLLPIQLHSQLNSTVFLLVTLPTVISFSYSQTLLPILHQTQLPS
jgi:hypothetical protein